MDWSKSSLYQQFLKSGLFKDSNSSIYSETEIQYFITIVRKMVKKKYKDDMTEEELKKIV